MFYALAHLEESFFVDNVHKVVLMAPCTICPPDPLHDESFYENSLYSFPSIGQYNIYGPHW